MLRGLLSFQGPYRILNLSWFAFFLSFVVWFNYAPFSGEIAQDLHLSVGQARTILLCNLALTIPARIVIGMILDRFGPRITFTALLLYAGLTSIAFASAQDFSQLVLSRLAMGVVGAGFVVGIRLVREWFDSHQMGFAQGVYGGWGNFGAFAAEAGLPALAFTLAFLAGGHSNWRLAIALSGIVAALYGVFFYTQVQNTPPGKDYLRPARHGGMEVTSAASFWTLMLTNVPVFGALGLITWRLQVVKLTTPGVTALIGASLVAVYFLQAYQAYQVNREVVSGHRQYPPEDRYQIGQVFMLELSYAATFGSELAVVSMLPEFFSQTFHLSQVLAGLLAATFPLMNLVARPMGGFISDRIGSRKWTLTLILGGIGLSYLVLSRVSGGWWLPLAMALVMVCSLFVCSGSGAVFAIAPLIKPRVTGQIAGNVGAYGSVGSVIYATIYGFLPQTAAGNQSFFEVLGIGALMVCFLTAFMLRDPRVPDPATEKDTLVIGH